MNEIAPKEGFDIVWQLATVYFVPTIAVLLLAISALYARFKVYANAVFFAASGVFLAIGEAVSVFLTGKTISSHHWGLDAANPQAGLTLNLLIGALFLVIIVHLAKIGIKRIRDDDEE